MADPDDVRQRLLEAAGPLFAERGKDGANVRDICEAAGVKNIGAVNYYFDSKEQFYVEAVRQASQACSQSAPWPDWPPGTPVEDRFLDFIRVFLRRLVNPRQVAWHRLLIMR